MNAGSLTTSPAVGASARSRADYRPAPPARPGARACERRSACGGSRAACESCEEACPVLASPDRTRLGLFVGPGWRRRWLLAGSTRHGEQPQPGKSVGEPTPVQPPAQAHGRGSRAQREGDANEGSAVNPPASACRQASSSCGTTAIPPSRILKTRWSGPPPPRSMWRTRRSRSGQRLHR